MPRESKATTSISKARAKVNARPAALTSPDEDGDSSIPRPPNAWILFRAAEQKKLLETRGNLTQPTISKIISGMWKDAPEDVRADYKRLAELKKAEHKVKHPTYRFRPKKKEETERLKKEKKLEKERKKVAGVNKARGKGASESCSPQAHSTSPSPIVPVALTVPASIPASPQGLQFPVAQSVNGIPNLHVPNMQIYQLRPVVANPWPVVQYGLYTPRQSAEPSPSPETYNSGMSENFGAVAPFSGEAVSYMDDEVLDISTEELVVITPDFDNSASNHTRFQLATPPYVPWDIPTTDDELQSTNGVLTLEVQMSRISENFYYQTPVNAVVSDTPSDDLLHVSADPAFDIDLSVSEFDLQYAMAAGTLNFAPANVHGRAHDEYFYNV